MWGHGWAWLGPGSTEEVGEDTHLPFHTLELPLPLLWDPLAPPSTLCPAPALRIGLGSATESVKGQILS